MEYVFDGPMPDVDPDGELVHPGQVVEFDGDPTWGGPWRPVEDGQDEQEPEPETKPAPAASAPVTAPTDPPADPAKDM